VSVPYSLKLLIQELAAMNIQLRIITEDNLHQIESMSYSDNLQKLTMQSNMTPAKLVEEVQKVLRKGPKAVNTPYADKYQPPSPEYMPPPQPRTPEYDPNSPVYNPTNAESPVYNPTNAESPVYNPTNAEFPVYNPTNAESPVYNPTNAESPSFEYHPTEYFPRESSEIKGGAYYVDDFKLGETVLFKKSVDLGLPYDKPWKIMKKGGKLLTIQTERNPYEPGRMSISKNELIQIVKPDELIKPDEYLKWQHKRQLAQHIPHFPVQLPQPQLQPIQQPNINIRVVAGDDNSKNGGSNQEEGQPEITVKKEDDFNSLVIPRPETEKKKETSEPKTSGGSIMSNLSDISKIFINKMM
jgi:hypothetical protein